MSAEKSYKITDPSVGKTEPSMNKSEATVAFTPPKSKGGSYGNSSGYAITEPSTNK